jgi:hypothetical protein
MRTLARVRVKRKARLCYKRPTHKKEIGQNVTSNKKRKDDLNPAQMFAMIQGILRRSEINKNENTRDNVLNEKSTRNCM